jgi:flavin reductase (DIM6/NTAB) family NADH-FMN oxidoreductase RutF
MDGPQEGNASLREVMGSYPTGVTIVAARDDGGLPFGLTINSFTSVSLEPPLVLICLGHASRCHDRLVSGGHFSVNLLAQDQSATASRFASEPSDGRFESVEWSKGPSGTPLLEGSIACLECSIQEVLSGGDHSIILGRVTHATMSDRPALMFHRGRFSTIGN